MTGTMEDQHRIDIGARIELLRTAQGETQTAWRRKYPQLITTNSKLANYEAGRSYPPYLFLVRISEDYGVSLDWLIKGDTGTSSTGVLLKRLRDLTTADRWPDGRRWNGGKARSPALAFQDEANPPPRSAGGVAAADDSVASCAAS